MRSHTSTYRVQLYDVDAFGELSSSAVLRFLQQTATDASAALGFDLEWYERERALWVIHRTTIDVLAPLFYRDELAVRTWVSDVRRVRSRREYELHRIPDEKPVGRGSTDWVYVDIDRGAPARPPAELQRALMPDGLVAKRRQPLSLATPPATAFQTNRRVEFADLDSAAHVNNTYYATYVEQALWDALAAHGWVINPLDRNARPRLRRLDLQYEGPARYGEQLDALVWSADVRADGFNAACVIRRDGACLLQASTDWHWPGDHVPTALRQAVVALTPAVAGPSLGVLTN